jgi:hypothetical protein
MNELKNADAEGIAQEMAKALSNMTEALPTVKQQSEAAMAILRPFLDAHPEIKRWEALAIGDRAVWLAKQATPSKL